MGVEIIYNLKCKSNTGFELNFTIPTRENPNCFVITDSKGLTENTITLATTQGVGQIGTTVQGQAVQGKPIVIEGVIVGEVATNRKLMLDTIVPLAELTLIFDNWLQIRAYAQSTPDIERKPHNANYQFTVYCPYPYWRTLQTILTDIAGLIPRFKFPINYYNTYFENPLIHMFGQRIQTFFVNVYNDGNVPAPFSVTFIAKTELSNPMITLVEQPVSTKFIVVEKDMVAGEIVTVDMTGDSIEATSRIGDTETDIFAYLGMDSTYFDLAVGDNLIRYDASSNREGLECRISRYTAYAGAFGNDATFI